MLRQACASATPLVTPYDAACINPASIDLRLGYEYRLPVYSKYYDQSLPVETWGRQYFLPDDGIPLESGQFILCCTLETVHVPLTACAALFSKSSTGRVGLEHLHAGWVDCGFNGQLTLEFKNVAPWPILLQPGKRYMQLVVYDLVAPASRSYAATGRYQHQTGATPARQEPHP